MYKIQTPGIVEGPLIESLTGVGVGVGVGVGIGVGDIVGVGDTLALGDGVALGAAVLTADELEVAVVDAVVDEAFVLTTCGLV
jgi:UDP-3-O-[3-hydroxymyristoyl] glucosamine N-acyltransferase